MKTYYPNILLPACMVLSCQLSTVAASAEAQPGYAVVVSDSATPLEQRTGALLEEAGIGVRVSGIGRQEGQRTIYVGVSLATMTLAKDRVDWATLGSDGIAIFEDTNANIVIAGGRPRGAVHAAVRFLEDRGGCRWWPDGGHFYPGKTNPGINPAKSLQNMTGLGGEGEETYELIGGPAFGGASMWPAAWALNDPGFGRERELGGTFYVANVAKSLETPGALADGSLCLSNEALRAAVTAAVRRDLEGMYPRVKRVGLGAGNFLIRMESSDMFGR